MALPSGWSQRLRVPVVVAPMFLVSSVDLVIAACRAGAIGTLPTPNARTVQDLEDWLRRIAEALSADDAPWGVNVVVHRTNDRLAHDMEVVERYRPPLVITALGNPRAIVERVHAWGGLVFADVNSLRYARQAAQLGVDGLVLVAAGAGGHTGHMAAFSMVPAIREFFGGTLVLGGGIVDGAGIRAVEVLGADLASMGTRFIACTETMASDAYRRMLVESSIEDLILTKAITGVSAYWLKQSLIAAGLEIESLEREIPIDFTDPKNAVRRWTQVWSAGHGVGAIQSIQSAGEVLSRLRDGYWNAASRQPALLPRAEVAA